MPKIVFTLDEQFSDLRSNEVAYKFTIENQGQNAIELLSITPRIPEGVELIQVKEASFVAVKAKYAELCSELTEILKDYLLFSSEEVRQKLVQFEKDSAKEVINSISNPFRAYLNLFTGTWNKNIEERRRKSNALFFKIETIRDAQFALTQWFDKPDNSSIVIKEIFTAKLKQLEQLGIEGGVEIKSASLATIEVGSLFSMTYILKYPRYYFSPRKFNIAIEAAYSELDKKYVGGAASSIVISPRPVAITILAVLSSLMGVVLKVVVDAANKPINVNNEIVRALTGGPAISAVILAIIFFNVYEHTDLGKKFSIGVGWRSALVVGALCGIGADRILAAIKTLVFGA